jgi:threonine synthase
MVAGSSFRKNPIVQSYLKGALECEDLKPDTIRETAVNEPLINWHSIDGELALSAIRDTGGWAAYASDRSMVASARALRDHEGLSVLPASTAGLIAVIEQHRRQPLGHDRYVVVITGRKS